MTTKLVIAQKITLLVAGALLILVGGFIIGAPVDFYAANSIELGANPSLLNELKAPAGMLLVAGLFMLAAIVVQAISDTAIALAALIYLSYAGARLASMAFDGMPAAGLVQAAALEAVVGLVCLGLFILKRIPSRRIL